MSEVSTTLIVIASVLFVIAQGLGVVSFVMLLLQNRRLKEITDKNVAMTAENEKLRRSQRLTAKILKRIRQKQKADKVEVVDGQMKMAELLTAGMKAMTDYMNASAKASTDSIFDVVNKNTEDVLRLNTENSQKVYDAMIVLIQMTNGLMTAMGYRPSAPVPESGLEDPKAGQSYNKPPAPVSQDGLTYAK
jgi:regulator of replication initiation timing